MTRSLSSIPLALAIAASFASAQTPTLPPLPAPLGIPRPGPATDAPYAPQPIVAGGIVVPLYPPGSPFLNAGRVREAEVYNLSTGRWLPSAAQLPQGRCSLGAAVEANGSVLAISGATDVNATVAATAEVDALAF